MNKRRNSHFQIHIDDLTEDCILFIFSLVTNIREKIRLKRVCKRWSAIAEESIKYHHTKLINVEDIYYENEIRNLQNLLDTIDNNELNNNEIYRYQISLSNIFYYYRNLKVFHIIKNPSFVYCIYNWNLNNDDKNNFNLLEIKIVNDDQINDNLLSTLVHKCSKLEKIEIINCSNVNGDFLFYLISNLKNLKLHDCQIDNRKLNNWILNFGRSIKCFDIACRSVDIGSILMSIKHSCLEIKELNLKNQIFDSFTDHWNLIGNLNCLEKLSIHNLENINDHLITSILNKNLRSLELNLDDSEQLFTADKLTCFKLFNQLCPLLESLSLFNIHQIDMIYFNCLIDLKNLNTILFSNCYQINYSSLIEFIKNAKKLKKIILIRSLELNANRIELNNLAKQNKIELIIN